MPREDAHVERYVAFLGGINVGGHRVTMDRLRGEVAALGYADVSTFIASGNVLFTAPPAGEHEARIETHLGERLGWPAPTFVRTAAEVRAATALRPFGPVADGHTHMVAFCRTAPDPAALEPLHSTVDRFVVDGRELHWHITGKLTSSTVTLPKLAKVIGPNTTRNVTSLTRLAALLDD